MDKVFLDSRLLKMSIFWNVSIVRQVQGTFDVHLPMCRLWHF
jgi:hypothetical protein